MQPLKRTVALIAAAATVVALAACTPATSADPIATQTAAPPAHTAPPAPPAPPVTGPLDTTPIPVNEYVARFSVTDGQIYGPDGIDEVNAEYREAARVFPLALPDGYAFPAETWLIGHGLPDGWQQGDGYAEAFIFWQKATATAAFHDFLLNNDEAGREHLDALAAGYESPVRAMFIDDPDLTYLDEVVAPAYEGDLDALYLNDAKHFLGNDIYANASARAGEAFNLGTEGYALAVP